MIDVASLVDRLIEHEGTLLGVVHRIPFARANLEGEVDLHVFRDLGDLDLSV